jgi:hypothetical protein
MHLPDLTLAQGVGTSLVSHQVQRHLIQLEASLPEGSQVELRLDWGDLTLPAVGSVPIARIVAGAVNWYHRQAPQALHPWPGYRDLATYRGRTTAIRWVKAQPGLPMVLTALGSVGADVAEAAAAPASEEAAAVLGLDLLPYAALIAAALAGFLIWQYLTHWAFLHHVEAALGQAAHAAATTVAPALLLVAVVAVPAYLILRR